MRAVLRNLIILAAVLFLPVCVFAGTLVDVSATGSNRADAINKALGESLVQALGSHVFSVTTMSGDRFSAMSTSVAGGRVEHYQVLEEYETFDGVHVRLQVRFLDRDLSELAPEEVQTWNQKLTDLGMWDWAQRTVGEYQRVLNEFLVGPRHQFDSGYAIVLRSYDVEAVEKGKIAGSIYVDITVNQSWWKTYYALVGALIPQGSQVINEGAVKVNGDTAGVDLARSSRVDRSLRYDLAHPLPVRLSVGTNVSYFILYKNALLVSAQPMTADSARNDYQRLQASRDEISLTKGNVNAGNALIDPEKSLLTCGVVARGSSAVYCGTRFTVKIPFEAENESEIVEVMKKGLGRS